ncbi:MAG: DUF2878 domain-containing protein [Acidobacteriota bacterium]
MRAFINFVAFQIGWFAAVLGAAHGMPWLGVVVIPAAVLLNLLLAADRRQELIVIFAAAILGFSVDTALVAAGIFAPVPFVFPLPFSPLWMVLLWVNLGNSLNACMAWLRDRYLVGAFFGAVGGPLAYVSGAKLGAAIPPSTGSIVILAIVWGGVFPSLLAVNAFVRKSLAPR